MYRCPPGCGGPLIKTIVFIHGAWVTPLCWERFIPYFEVRGYRCIAPAWPGKDRPIDEIRRDPSALAGLGVGEIVHQVIEESAHLFNSTMNAAAFTRSRDSNCMYT